MEGRPLNTEEGARLSLYRAWGTTARRRGRKGTGKHVASGGDASAGIDLVADRSRRHADFELGGAQGRRSRRQGRGDEDSA